jgi:hypothetical protein
MNNLLKALVSAQSEITNPVKDSKNPHFKNNYASLESVLDAVTKPLNKHGLVLTQTIIPHPIVSLVTTLWHAESGERIDSVIPLNPSKQDPQGYAAACTYYRRMTIKSLLGLAEVDDDGTAASAPVPAPAKPGATVQRVITKMSGTIVPTMDAMTLCGALREAKTLDELDALAAQAKSLPETERGEAREIYAKRKGELA